MKKIGFGLVALLLIGLVVVVVANWALLQQLAKFSPLIPPHVSPLAASEPQARLEDLAYLQTLLRYDRSFDEAEREQFEELLAGARDDAGTMSLAELYLLAAEAAALADNAHTNVFLEQARQQFSSAGLRYGDFADGVYVVSALAGQEALLGRRVLALDGRPIGEVLSELDAYTGGADGWRRRWSLVLLESPELLHAAGLLEASDGYRLTLQNEDGAADVVDVAAVAPPGDEAAWVDALQDVPEEQRPFYLQDPAQRFMWVPLEDGGGYLRLHAILNSAEQTLSEFLAETVGELPDGSLPYLVVDLRANGGGDFTHVVDDTPWIADKVADDGNLYIAVGPRTLSAAIATTALLKFHGGERSHIIGQPMGDGEQFWSEWGAPFTLPNSGFQVGYATGYHDWANGCAGHPYCFTPVLNRGVSAGSLMPEQTIVPTYADYAAGRDVVLEWVQAQEQS